MRRAAGIATAFGLGVVAVLGVWAVVRLAGRERADPARCPTGLVARGPRCCAPSQTERDGACRGAPAACPDGMEATPDGCVVRHRRVALPGGLIQFGPEDWESLDQVRPFEATVRPFRIDAYEVTHARWNRCVDARVCAARDTIEPGIPVTGLTVDEARAFCRFAGGRLPTSAEWLFAAVGTEKNRFPWGPTGIVCRRAAFGLVAGPCGNGARGPDLTGARPDGRTAAGIFDLAGNVAEWTLGEKGKAEVRGGSFRSTLAGELKSWAMERAVPSDHTGFRCAYSAAMPR
jgi:formylglycine-generating enzyme required for sulfatase activity